MQISKSRLEEMIQEVVPEVARDLLEDLEEGPDVGDIVEIVGTEKKGEIEERSDNRYWVSFKSEDGGQFFEPRHLNVIEDES